MPHIKVTPFTADKFAKLVKEEDSFAFHAVADKLDGEEMGEELLGLDFEDEEFILEIQKRNDAYLIKPSKHTRPLDVNIIKRALAYVAERASLEIVQENIAFSSTKPPLANKYYKTIEDFEAISFEGRKISIEVGFGSGRHLLFQAKSNPDILFIGIEIHTPSAQQVLKQIKIQNLTNIWIVNYDARLLLEMLPSNVAKTVYVHFPVPWDKKPHRRVIGSSFVSEALRVLELDGMLELRTDSDNYYSYALEIFSQPKKSHFEVRKNSEAAIRSKYEDRWQRQEKDIYTLYLYSHEESPELDKSYDFAFSLPAKNVEELYLLPKKAIVDMDYFVHFERFYRLISGDGMLIQCSFGNFDRPEHKFIIVKDGVGEYYPHPPVKSRGNSKAHKKIGEYIYV